MRDITDNSERVLVMRDGRETAELRTTEASANQIIAAMGGSIGADPPMAQPATEPARHANAELSGQGQAPLLSRPAGGGTGEELSFTVLPGEIVGLAGLEGQGQTELLAEIWRMSRRSGWLWRGRRRWAMARRFSAAYVSGDRQQFGLLPLWEVRRNISVASLSSLRSFGLLLAGRERSLTADWVKRVQIREGAERSVLELSGGTQQKVLLARGMAARSDVLLLDDPFRGVDVITKEAAYRWIRDEADSGKAVVWYSSETAEFHKCDRAYVMREGTVRAVLSGPEISDDSLIRYSFDTYATARDHPGSHVAPADGRSAGDV